ncbi:diguanylate cyclase domain-containing protein [Sedimentibacter sp.]|uniref:diguanylate cyclase domain-containing protein n=1 Tax=Sedimentibacter sp. TaxID=1960295 RepID=UPI00289D7476|nr:diguanylate cyclase [Sedimentibacter sp.]
MILSNIDMATILLILVLGHFLTGIFIFAYSWKHNRSKPINVFLVSKLCQLIGWGILGLRGIIPDVVLISVGNSYADSDTRIKYTISIGFLSMLPDEKTDVDNLYKLSDQALYLAKSQGKNCSRRAVIPSRENHGGTNERK